MELRFTFEDHRTGHGDLVLRFGEQEWRCDSYYLALDQGVLAKREDARKVRAVLRALLENWRKAIEGLATGATVYLPYDFSDQGTVWLACEREGENLLVRHGWANVEGWSIAPSTPWAPGAKPSGFQADGGPWSVSVDEFLNGIARSIEAAVG